MCEWPGPQTSVARKFRVILFAPGYDIFRKTVARQYGTIHGGAESLNISYSWKILLIRGEKIESGYLRELL
jgi:hypothetical protein